MQIGLFRSKALYSQISLAPEPTMWAVGLEPGYAGVKGVCYFSTKKSIKLFLWSQLQESRFFYCHAMVLVVIWIGKVI